MTAPDLKEWMDFILSQDPMTFEDAYWGVRPHQEIAVPMILDKMKTAYDSFTRGKLIELLGESEDISVKATLENELNHEDGKIREWASSAIEALNRGEKWQRNPQY